MNRTTFYEAVRTPLFAGKISVKQLAGMEAFHNEWERQQLTDLRWLAYMLATAYHETARTMQPIEEFGKGRKLDYGKKLKMGRGPGKRTPYLTPDKLYYGRGHTQNTWFENYEKLTKAAARQGFNWNFLNQPELLLEMQPSIWATFFAMQTGLYTGKTLMHFFNDTTEDWKNARKIINGLDKAEQIANQAKIFFAALQQARVATPV